MENIIISLSIISPLIASIINLGLGILVLTSCKRNKIRYYYFFSSISIAIATFSCYIQGITKNYRLALFADHSLHISALLYASFFLLFISHFCQTKKKLFLLLIPFIIIIIYFDLSNTIRTGIALRFNIRYIIQPSTYYTAFTIVYSTLLIIPLIDIIKSKVSKGYFIAFISLLITNITYFLLIPDIFSINTFAILNLLSSLGAALYGIVTAYLILRHQLFDIKFVIRRSAYYSILFGLLFASLMALNTYVLAHLHLGTKIQMVIYIGSGLLLYELLSRSINRLTENMFIKRKHNFKDIIDMSESLDAQKARAEERDKYAAIMQEKNEELAKANLELLNMIQEKEKLEKIVIKQQRNAAVGEVAGEIAHELKNSLAGFEEFIINLKEEPQLIHKYHDKIRETIKKGFETIQYLLEQYKDKENIS